ncbi:MAG: DUF5615 family PIN-like protein [Pirellulales bacterium]
MLFLADESSDFAVARALRAAGHEVATVADIAPRADDDQVLQLARNEQRILLTEDKDFGQLVFADQQANGGVILMRYPANARSSLPGDVLRLVAIRGSDLVGRFVVMKPGRYRLGVKKP